MIVFLVACKSDSAGSGHSTRPDRVQNCLLDSLQLFPSFSASVTTFARISIVLEILHRRAPDDDVVRSSRSHFAFVNAHDYYRPFRTQFSIINLSVHARAQHVFGGSGFWLLGNAAVR